MIFVLGSIDDDHATAMLSHLKRSGRNAALLDSKDFPQALRLTFEPNSGVGAITWPRGPTVSFDEISAVYWRTYDGVGAPALADPEQAQIAWEDARALFETLLAHAPARWVNSWRAIQLHRTKPVQLARVAALGVAIPQTCLSNDPAAVRAFAARHPRAIFKPVQGGAHTRRLTPDHLTETALARLALAPVTLQEEILGVDVRVFVAGDRVMACAITTDAVDFRDDPAAPIRPHDLPPAVADDCRRIAAALDLCWTGIDMRRTREGRYVFLEANPSPMFLEFEARSGLPLTAALADLLTNGAAP